MRWVLVLLERKKLDSNRYPVDGFLDLQGAAREVWPRSGGGHPLAAPSGVGAEGYHGVRRCQTRPEMTDSAPDAGSGAVLDTDAEHLAIPLLTLARELLERNGSLYPFGGFLPAGGGEAEVITPRGDSPYPLVDRVFQEVVVELRGVIESGRADAVAVCADVVVRLPDDDAGTDAVRVSVERPGRPPRAYHLPYRRVGQELRFEDLIVAPADPLVLA
jgi:hypothetical protein